jgi:hypothetical protein
LQTHSGAPPRNEIVLLMESRCLFVSTVESKICTSLFISSTAASDSATLSYSGLGAFGLRPTAEQLDEIRLV